MTPAAEMELIERLRAHVGFPLPWCYSDHQALEFVRKFRERADKEGYERGLREVKQVNEDTNDPTGT